MYWTVVISGVKDDIEEDNIQQQEFDFEDDALNAHSEIVDGVAQDFIWQHGYTEITVRTVKHNWVDKVIRETVFFRDGAVNDVVF